MNTRKTSLRVAVATVAFCFLPQALEAADADAQTRALGEPLPQIGEDRLAEFELQRGAYVSTDLGVFTTLSGTQGASNLQPYLAIAAGYDVSEHVGVQASFASGYSAGSPVNENEDPARVGPQATVDYEVFMMSAELVGAFRPSERISIEPQLGGGVSRVAPQLRRSDDPSTFYSSFLPHLTAGVDLKYLTLLTDFSAGISVTGYYILGPSIVALATGGVVRYTF